MIDEIVAQWNERKEQLEAWLREEHPPSYEAIVGQLVTLVLTDELDGYGRLDPDRIHRIDDGSYQGVEIYLIPKGTYPPDASEYVWFDNYYGSCSGCDALEAIRGWEDGPPDEDQVKQYMDLALHMVQRMKWLDPETP